MHTSGWCQASVAMPHLVLCVLCQDVQGAYTKPELARVCELANACPQGHQLVT